MMRPRTLSSESFRTQGCGALSPACAGVRGGKMGKGGKFLAGTVIGAAIGAVLGLLFAPKSGKELRANIAERAEEMKKKMEVKRAEMKMLAEKAKVRGKKLSRSAAQKAKELYEEAKAEYEEAKEEYEKMAKKG